MAFLPVASGDKHVRTFVAFGWVLRKAKNGHFILTQSGVPVILSIPDHKEVKLPLLRAELRKAGIDADAYCDKFSATN